MSAADDHGGHAEQRHPRDRRALGEHRQHRVGHGHAGGVAEDAGDHARDDRLEQDEPRDLLPPEADGAEHADLGGALAHRAHHGEEHDEDLDAHDDADDDEAESLELVHRVQAARHRLADRRHLGLRQSRGELAHDLVDGSAGVRGRDLDERELSRAPQHPLHGAEPGDEQLVVLPARRPEDAGDGEALATDAHVVAHVQCQHLGGPGAGDELAVVLRWPAGADRPPALELELRRRVDAHEQGAAALDLHRADELRRDDGDAAARRDRAHALEVGLVAGPGRRRSRRRHRCRRT